MPERNAGGYRDIKGVLGAELRNLKADIGSVDHRGVNAMHLMPGNNGIFSCRIGPEVAQIHTFFHLLEGADSVALRFQAPDAIERRVEMEP